MTQRSSRNLSPLLHLWRCLAWSRRSLCFRRSPCNAAHKLDRYVIPGSLRTAAAPVPRSRPPADLGTCRRTTEPVAQAGLHYCGSRLTIDPVQAPPLRHAFELVTASLLEADFRRRRQILDRTRDQDFARARLRGDARTDVKRETDNVSPAHFVFAYVQPHPDLQPQCAHCLADCGRAMDPRRRRVECREQSVSRRHDFFSAQSLQLSADGGVVVIHHLCPARFAPPRRFFGGPDDIDKQDRGKCLCEFAATIGRSAPDRNISSQRFIAMAAPPCGCVFYVVFGRLHRTATNYFLARWNRPVNLSSISHAVDLDGAPLQENRRANPANPPCF